MELGRGVHTETARIRSNGLLQPPSFSYVFIILLLDNFVSVFRPQDNIDILKVSLKLKSDNSFLSCSEVCSQL